MEHNQERYESAGVVKHYESYSKDLQPAESVILSRFSNTLADMRILDIGVGAGRTTPFLAGVAKEYTAIDFSQRMIDICIRKFSNAYPRARFLRMDARDLSSLPQKHFDLVLFSFNGIDTVSCADRKIILEQLKSVSVTGGYCCFSSHNILYLPEFFKIHFRLHPFKFLRSVIGRRKLIRRNLAAIEKMNAADCVEILDGVYDFDIRNAYVRPSFQASQLRSIGFTEVELFDLSGHKLTEGEGASCKDAWIYYLCRG